MKLNAALLLSLVKQSSFCARWFGIDLSAESSGEGRVPCPAMVRGNRDGA
jgi:hypothetical protein